MLRARTASASATNTARWVAHKTLHCPFTITYVTRSFFLRDNRLTARVALNSFYMQNIAAQQNHRDACFALTAWYLVGSPGVLPQSDTEAFLWAKRAADAGLAKAMYAVGYFYEVAIGTPPNHHQCVHTFQPYRLCVLTKHCRRTGHQLCTKRLPSLVTRVRRSV